MTSTLCRVAVAEEKIAKAKENVLNAPFYKKLEQLLEHHCPGRLKVCA